MIWTQVLQIAGVLHPLLATSTSRVGFFRLPPDGGDMPPPLPHCCWLVYGRFQQQPSQLFANLTSERDNYLDSFERAVSLSCLEKVRST